MHLEEAQQYLQELVRLGGPRSDQYETTLRAFEVLVNCGVPSASIRELLTSVLTHDTMQGFGLLKPHGYAGDFEMIDRIYTGWVSPHPLRAAWDNFFHAQHAPRAVRNRKEYFLNCLKAVVLRKTKNVRILNVGSGPARDVFDFFTLYPQSLNTHFDCIDLDDKAIAYASKLCYRHLSKVSFYRQNLLHFKMPYRYDLIWSAGLFDYLSDRLFIFALRRLFSHLGDAGEMIIGNFASSNPSRLWMESIGDWTLQHRSPEQLIALSEDAGIPASLVSIGNEPLGVNLFLHIQNIVT